ncbi:hypothetical protein T03_13557 [Trichinella britovi]|uniref:Uncharacterized protein n=1 Tax=Trichinella britovi TaxID=45882 RepID=A0A0V1CKA5_TRIBR|nr:hypothetical protein T03_13557 [Trichinella britovi]
MAFALSNTCDQTVDLGYSTITNITVSLMQLHLIRTEFVSTSHSGSDKYDRILENVLSLAFCLSLVTTNGLTGTTMQGNCGDHVALLEQQKRLDNVNKSDSFLNDFV